jgi:DNA gyrase subunit A
MSRWSCRRAFPNLLINGSSGIAVGMATNIPPHNLNEVVDACCLALLGDPEMTIDELIDIMPAPDFPTAGIIYGVGVREGYRTGRGRVVMRGRRCISRRSTRATGVRRSSSTSCRTGEQADAARKDRRAGQREAIEGISDLRDESDKSGMRVVIELKRGEVPRWCSTICTSRRSCRTPSA